MSHAPTTDRIAAIDTLRGFALLGILVMNIQSFAMVDGAYFNPSLHMDLTGVNWAVWTVSHIFADMKFMAIFSILFGAGIVLMSDARAAGGRPVVGLHLKRTFWLFVFGMIHAYLIWPGDILVTYAIAGLVVFWLRNKTPRTLFIWAGLMLAVAPLIGLLGAAAATYGPAEVRADIVAGFGYTAQEIADEIAAYRGSWIDGFQARVSVAVYQQLDAIPFFLFWRAGGLMLMGMALFKLGVLTAVCTPRTYRKIAIGGLVIGLPLCITSVVMNADAGWDPVYSLLGVGALWNYIGSIAMALAYIAGVMLAVKSGLLQGVQARLAAVGRMAFTNYIAQSVICTAVFYGWGLGLFGYVDRWGQLLIVLAVWALQLWWSPWWLRRYRFGPLEWAWRSLTYLQAQPMVRRASPN
ncbi:MAG: DUF418 domain-containing protein [Pseudomonadota bacterium]